MVPLVLHPVYFINKTYICLNSIARFMKTTLAILISSCAFLLFSCHKDKFATKPLIEVKSYSSREIPPNGQLTLRLNYFDKEGDLGTGAFWAARYRLNVFPLPSNQNKADTLNYTLPDFPKRDNGEISLELGYASFLKESVTENDTIYFRIAVTDKAGNKSDTITTEPVVVLLH
jgi:hypothetical protein